MATTYPPSGPTFTGDAKTIHRLLAEPATVARRVQSLANRAYVADVLLKERLEVAGGAITYESGEPLGTTENPRAVAPGADYPLVSLTDGNPSVAKTTKWGQDVMVTDEAIKRLKISPVNRAFRRLVNQNVMYIDSVAMSAITSALTSTTPVTASWTAITTDAEQILRDVLFAVARKQKLELGISPDTVALDPLIYAAVKAKFMAAGYLPREAGNPLTGGDWFNVENLTWVPTPHGINGSVVVADTDLLGGMADEDLDSPGYAQARPEDGSAPVEVKTIRDDDNDRYKLRARRVTVPVILEPLAGEVLTGADA